MGLDILWVDVDILLQSILELGCTVCVPFRDSLHNGTEIADNEYPVMPSYGSDSRK
eukprot:m.1685965 g.1685965  ORF g.1685965 m.1685965 type:complete len:56 (+) comp259501_c0_seq1:31-198(+)